MPIPVYEAIHYFGKLTSLPANRSLSSAFPSGESHARKDSSVVSHVLIQYYLNQLQDLRKVSGTHRETVVREAFKDLLKGWGRQHDLVFVPE